MKPFDLKEYNRLVAEGKTPKLVTRDGRSAKIICTDRDNHFQVVALVKGKFTEMVLTYSSKGAYSEGADENPELASEYDLFFADPKPTYRPFNDSKEVMDAVREHGDWIDLGKNEYRQIIAIYPHSKVVVIGTGSCFDFKDLLNCKWVNNGDVCGIKED